MGGKPVGGNDSNNSSHRRRTFSHTDILSDWQTERQTERETGPDRTRQCFESEKEQTRMKREDSAVEISEYSHTIWAVISSQANTTAIDTTESRPANEVSNQVSLGGWGAELLLLLQQKS